jgi:hypothetical protein
MIGRRGILRSFGGLVAAASVKNISNPALNPTLNPTFLSQGISDYPVAGCSTNKDYDYNDCPTAGFNKEDTRSKALQYLLAEGLPEYEIQRIKEAEKRKHLTLDPDLYVSKSFSLTTRMRMQLQRNIDRSIKESLKHALHRVGPAIEESWLSRWV